MGFVQRGVQAALPYEDLYYDGETALHIAVAKGDSELVHMLLQKGVSCRLRANGSFFVPGGESGCYLGEYALSFAASGGLDEMVRILTAYDPDSVTYRDSFSNTALHLAVLHNRMSTYNLLVTLSNKTHADTALDKGSMGMTPLSLAALYSLRTGDKEPYDAVINATKSVVWSFMDVTSYSYPLEQIDTVTWKPQPKTKVLGEHGDIEMGEGTLREAPLERADQAPCDMYTSILFLAIQYELIALAEDDILVSLLETKWVSLRYIFYFSILWHGAYLGILTALTVLNHPYGREPTLIDWVAAGMTIVGTLPSVFDIVMGIRDYRDLQAIHRWSQTRAPPKPDILHEQAWASYKDREPQTIGNDFSFVKQLISSFPISGFDLVAWVGYGFYAASRAVDDRIHDHEKGTAPLDKNSEGLPLTLAFLGASTMCAWVSTLTYAPVHERTGMLVTMMTRTIFQDLFPFILVFSFILMGSAIAVFSLQRKGFTLPVTVDAFMRLSIGIYAYDTYEPQGLGDGPRQISYILILMFTLVSLVLMLNLLIATFTSTYEEVKDLAHKEWRLLWGRDILMLERRVQVFSCMARRLRVNHGSSDQHVFISIKNAAKVEEDKGRTKRRKIRPSITDFKKCKNDMAQIVRLVSSMNTIKDAVRPALEDKPSEPVENPLQASHAPKKKKKRKSRMTPPPTPDFVKAPPLPLTGTTACESCGTLLNFTTHKYPIKVMCAKCKAVTRLSAPTTPSPTPLAPGVISDVK
eukprot:TRINITY_DN14902_c0_g1_i1.p1 TRINITY_DN14902_c0_g1~~TRINITY_DN14902_c0_g1_i1.p1  ORF type:complete len:871 (+),score=263.39 TRINITY_DN14902_c0_g1_i1:363-2615(+)